MRLWLHRDLRRPQPFFTLALRSSRTREFTSSRIPSRTGRFFTAAGIEIGVGVSMQYFLVFYSRLCTIFRLIRACFRFVNHWVLQKQRKVFFWKTFRAIRKTVGGNRLARSRFSIFQGLFFTPIAIIRKKHKTYRVYSNA